MLKDEAAPPARSLKIINTFNAYSERDSPDKSLGSPFIRFQDFAAYPNDSQNLHLEDYRGLQVTVLPFKDLWKLIDSNWFCANVTDVYLGKARDTLILREVADLNMTNLHLSVHNIHFKAATTGASPTTDFQIPILQTGTYSILLSNCGSFTAAKVSGSIIVRHSYGYLPGNEYRKLPFYKGLSLVYLLLCLLWMCLSIKGRSGLFNIQVFIGGVLLTGLGEAAIWCATLTDWNSTGFQPVNLNTLALFASVFKSVGCYALTLLASLGWGVWRPHLECETVVKAIILCLLLIIAECVHDYVLSFRQTHPTPMITVFLLWVPVALCNCIAYLWILQALTASIAIMRERKQEEKLLLFERLWNILILALMLATITVLIQVYVLTWALDVRWHYQWLFTDVGAHVLFASVLIAMMYLWAPSNGSERYTYANVANNEVEGQSEQFDNVPEVVGDAVWAEEEDDVFGEDVEEADGDTFWGATKANSNKVAPEPDLIGICMDDK